MTFDELSYYALKKRGARADYPFGIESLFIKAGKHYFVNFALVHGERTMSVRCTEEDGVFYRGRYPDSVTRGCHCPPVQQPTNNTVFLDRSAIPDAEILKMIDRAYRFVVGRFTKRERAEFEAEK